MEHRTAVIFTDKKIKALFCANAAIFAVFAVASLLFLCFVPEKAAFFIFAAAVCAAAAAAAVLVIFLKKQNDIIERADDTIAAYISGNTDARIDCESEGGLYKLFHRINSLAAILNAHAENELRAKEFLKDAMSDISHQLKTPLTALNIYNGLISEAEDIAEVREYASLSEEELDRTSEMVRELLELAKLDAGAVAFKRERENIAELMEGVKRRFEFRAEREGKEIRLKGGDAELICDIRRTSEAIANIVKNSLDHTDAGGVTEIEWVRTGSVIRVEIRDNGRGIPKEDIYHIFKRFYRSRNSDDTSGAGLGLPIAKSIIEKQGGTVEAASEPGRGTVFTVNFLIPTKL